MDKIKILYFFDPLCGWCYGFSGVIKQLEKEFTEISFEAMSGGMVLGDRVGPIGAMKDYLQQAIPHLEKTTGVKMGKPYMDMLEEGSRVLNSERPCIAMTVFKSMSNKSSVQFASALQAKLYQEAADLDADQAYQELCEAFDLPWEVFQNKLNDPSYKQRTYDEFKFVGSLGVSGYPTVALIQGDKGYLLARGYRTMEEMKSSIQEVTKELKESQKA